MAIALVMVAGAAFAVLAVVHTTAALLAVAGLLLLGGIVGATVLAQRRIERPGPRAAVVAGTVALAAVIFVPASGNVDRCARLGRDADLAGCDLSERDLSTEDLRGADLSGADLDGTDLGGVDLVGADLRRASLRGTDLSEARLSGVTATDADLRDATFDGAALAGSDLTGATADGAAFTETDLSNAVLAGVDLASADLTGATLEGTDLSGTSLAGLDLGGAELSGADLSDADLSGADLTEAALDDANLQGALLVAAGLTGATLGDTDLRGADLSRADLTGVAAPGADFADAVFARTHLEANDFVGAEGITDEALAAAFEAPTSRLASATARRSVVLDSTADIIAAVTPLRDGRAVPEVQAYTPSGEFHPAIIFAADGAPAWANADQGQWAPTAIRYAELVVMVQPGPRESVEVCPYTLNGAPAPSITRYVTSVTVRVLSAHDARVVAEQAFRGPDPRQCQPFEPYSLREIDGEPPDFGTQVRPWLTELIHPPPDRPRST